MLLLILLQTNAGWSFFKRMSEIVRLYGLGMLKTAVAWVSPSSATDAKGPPVDSRYHTNSSLGLRVSTLTGEMKPRRKRRLTVRRAVNEDAEDGGWTCWGPWKWRRAKRGGGVEVANVEGLKV